MLRDYRCGQHWLDGSVPLPSQMLAHAELSMFSMRMSMHWTAYSPVSVKRVASMPGQSKRDVNASCGTSARGMNGRNCSDYCSVQIVRLGEGVTETVPTVMHMLMEHDNICEGTTTGSG